MPTTQKLFLENPYDTEFEAEVISADENGIRCRKAGEYGRCRSFDHGKTGHTELSGIGPDTGGTLVGCFDRNRAQRGVRKHPFDADRTGARADIPE